LEFDFFESRYGVLEFGIWILGLPATRQVIGFVKFVKVIKFIKFIKFVKLLDPPAARQVIGYLYEEKK
jgi:hypothetical protein